MDTYLDDYKKPFVAEYEIEDWDSFSAGLEHEGYFGGYGARNPVALVDGQSIDAEVAQAGICPVHNKPSEYRAYWYHTGRDGRAGHRAFAVCVDCNKATEF